MSKDIISWCMSRCGRRLWTRQVASHKQRSPERFRCPAVNPPKQMRAAVSTSASHFTGQRISCCEEERELTFKGHWIYPERPAASAIGGRLERIHIDVHIISLLSPQPLMHRPPPGYRELVRACGPSPGFWSLLIVHVRDAF